VSQDVIVREGRLRHQPRHRDDHRRARGDGSIIRDQHVETSVYARTLAEDITDTDGNVLLNRGDDLGDQAIEKLSGAGVTRAKVRSVLTCESAVGVCATCYGRSMATGQLVDVARRSASWPRSRSVSPGTQLTMRTFHQGGVAGEDITTGLPRVQELFEARVPRARRRSPTWTVGVRIEERRPVLGRSR
jgi:DNA-directed RNA polymerase subunit beta'